MLRTSPARWKWEQEHPTTKKVFEFGKAAHAKVLGVGSVITVIPADLLATNGAESTTKAKDFRAEHEAAGEVVLKAADAEVVDAMAAAIEDHHEARALLADGTAEQSMAWRDPDTRILMRGRTDWVTEWRGTPVVVDYKTCSDANPDEFRWDARNFDYHMQDAWYRQMRDGITGTPHGFLFIAQEKTPPYLVSVVQLDDESRARGHERNQLARAVWLECMTADHWPAYPGITTINVP